MTEQRRRNGGTPARLCLLGGFSLIVNESPVPLQIHPQRLLAYLSLTQPAHVAHSRTALAERLWANASMERCQANLRTALWRINRADARLVRASRVTVRLDDSVDLDVRRCDAQASRLLADGALLDPSDMDISSLRGELLPDWDEDWLLLERERIRLVQIHALEALARRLCGLGRHPEAVEAAFAALAREPLRESTNAILIDIFLAERNVAQAHQQLERYAALLWSQLGIKPSAELVHRVAAANGRLPAGVVR
jgi:DNA-binding SARP family transcriptional activator